MHLQLNIADTEGPLFVQIHMQSQIPTSDAAWLTCGSFCHTLGLISRLGCWPREIILESSLGSDVRPKPPLVTASGPRGLPIRGDWGMPSGDGLAPCPDPAVSTEDLLLMTWPSSA